MPKTKLIPVNRGYMFSKKPRRCSSACVEQADAIIRRIRVAAALPQYVRIFLKITGFQILRTIFPRSFRAPQIHYLTGFRPVFLFSCTALQNWQPILTPFSVMERSKRQIRITSFRWLLICTTKTQRSPSRLPMLISIGAG